LTVQTADPSIKAKVMMSIWDENGKKLNWNEKDKELEIDTSKSRTYDAGVSAKETEIVVLLRIKSWTKTSQ